LSSEAVLLEDAGADLERIFEIAEKRSFLCTIAYAIVIDKMEKVRSLLRQLQRDTFFMSSPPPLPVFNLYR